MPHGNDPLLPGALAVSAPALPARGASESHSGAASMASAVRACLAVSPFLGEIEELYAEVDAEVACRDVRCMGGGPCCKFDLTGRWVYLSAGELAVLCRRPPPRPAQSLRSRCAYQVGPRCTARRRRPLGCRVFFCDVQTAEFCAELYEKSHARLRRLHEEYSLTYVYAGLTAGLAELFPCSAELCFSR